MTDQPGQSVEAPQRIAMRILAGTLPFTPGMDPNNPMHVLHIEFGPVIQEIQLPESNVEPFIEAITGALRRQVEASRAERLGVQPPGLLLPGAGMAPGDFDNLMRQMRDAPVRPMPPEIAP